jgi:hypothetical protein
MEIAFVVWNSKVYKVKIFTTMVDVDYERIQKIENVKTKNFTEVNIKGVRKNLLVFRTTILNVK